MKLIIFGSTGKIGRNLVDQALGQGHQVTAFARKPETLGPLRENLAVVQGDVLDASAVSKAISGQDAVLCALGMPILNKDRIRARGTKIIVDAMEHAGTKRLVCLSAYGTGESFNALPLHYKFFIAPLLMRHMFDDHGRQEAHIRNSTLDWVIVRPGNFVKGPATGTYRHGFTAADPAPTLKIAQGDVAEFMLKHIFNRSYLGKAPAISY